MTFYAHSRDDGNYQLLKEHLECVAIKASEYGDAFGIGQLAYLAGLLHDVGKYSEPFQQRVRGRNIKVDHSTAGAKWILNKQSYNNHIGSTGMDRYLAQLIAMSISGHHGGLQNYGSIDEEGSFKRRVSKGNSEIPAWSSAWDEIEVPKLRITLPSLFQKDNLIEKQANIAWMYSFFGRMLYSCLVDADSIDTRNYTRDEDRVLMEQRTQPTMEQLLERLNGFLNSFTTTKQSEINQQRQSIQDTCRRQACINEQGLFSLTVPTGGGKTLSSMVFALEHAKRHYLRRVIYVIPFTSIIEQNANVFRRALGEDAILEHHSNFNQVDDDENFDAETARLFKLSSENWDASVVVTTSVQFFESLFSNKRSKCRKLHNIVGSVIVIDEAQSIPSGYMKPCLHAMQELIDHYNCSIVLCTATQPSWDKLGFKVKEIMDKPTPFQLFRTFKRVRITSHGAVDDVVTDETVSEWITDNEQVLCIVNTRKHARLLYDRMKNSDVEGMYHLSGRMCAAHRKDMLEEIKERLIDGLPCRVISTQLIEAGVDVDFPKVLRAMTGLDSIAQAAGRCNREGKLAIGEVIVFYPERHGMPTKGWLKETAVEAQHVLRYEEDPMSQSAMLNYFDRIYGIKDSTVDQKTDQQSIMKLLKDKNANFEIPYEEIAERFVFIDGQMQSIVVPYDEKAREIIQQLPYSKYPSSELRKLQAYSVQVYQYELTALLGADLIGKSGGVLYLTESAYYSFETGLLQPNDMVEHEVLLF